MMSEKNVCRIQRPSISSGFGCWATQTRRNKIHKGCIQAIWNADVSTTARILLKTKGKATK
jgi:hypothetical protein